MRKENALRAEPAAASPLDEFFPDELGEPPVDGVYGSRHIARQRVEVRIAVGSGARLPEIKSQAPVQAFCAKRDALEPQHGDWYANGVEAIRVEGFARAHPAPTCKPRVRARVRRAAPPAQPVDSTAAEGPRPPAELEGACIALRCCGFCLRRHAIGRDPQ